MGDGGSLCRGVCLERLHTSRRHWEQQEATGSNRKQQKVAAVYYVYTPRPQTLCTLPSCIFRSSDDPFGGAAAFRIAVVAGESTSVRSSSSVDRGSVDRGSVDRALEPPLEPPLEPREKVRRSRPPTPPPLPLPLPLPLPKPLRDPPLGCMYEFEPEPPPVEFEFEFESGLPGRPW